MAMLTKDGLRGEAPPRMTGSVRRTAPPLMRRAPDPASFVEHRTADGRGVFIAKSVLADLADLERSEHPVETASLLFGGFFSDGENVCAIVTRLVLPKPGEVVGTPSTVTITAEGSEQMIERAWLEDPLLKPLGWGHTHPCFEAYFSGVDREEQSVWTEPASVGLVMSGLAEPRDRYRVFVGPESEPAEPAVGGAPRRIRAAAQEEVPVEPHRRPPRRLTRALELDAELRVAFLARFTHRLSKALRLGPACRGQKCLTRCISVHIPAYISSSSLFRYKKSAGKSMLWRFALTELLANHRQGGPGQRASPFCGKLGGWTLGIRTYLSCIRLLTRGLERRRRGCSRHLGRAS
jgi:proteasome lid subunit RPN8/RPN11